MHILLGAKVSYPQRRQIAEVAQSTLGGQRGEFEAVFEEIGLCGDAKRAAIMFRAADNDQGRFELFIRRHDAETGKLIAKELADALPPVGEDPYASFQIEIERIDHHAVGAGSGYADEVALLFRMREGSRQAKRDVPQVPAHKTLRGARNVPGKSQFLGQNIGCAAGKQSKRNAMSGLRCGHTVDDFVDRAVSAAGNEELAAFGSGATGNFGRIAWSARLQEIGVNACGEIGRASCRE